MEIPSKQLAEITINNNNSDPNIPGKISIKFTPYTETRRFRVNGELRDINVHKLVQLPFTKKCCICLDLLANVIDSISICSSVPPHLLHRKCAVDLEKSTKSGNQKLRCPECKQDAIPQHRPELLETWDTALKSMPFICPVGCQSEILDKDLDKHIASCKPAQCLPCGYKDTQQNLKEHIGHCPEEKLNCQACFESIKRSSLTNHQQSCPEVEETAFIGISGKGVRLKRKHILTLQTPDNRELTEALCALSKQVSPPESQQLASAEAPPSLNLLEQWQPRKLLADIYFSQTDLQSLTLESVDKNGG